MRVMLGLLARRAAFGVVTLVVISLLVFLGVEALPGDLAQAVLGQSATPETVAVLRAQLGLDVPAHLRYLHWIVAALHGDFGHSLASQRPVAELLAERLPNTALLAGVAALVSMPLAVGLGIMAALHHDRRFDRASSLITLIGISLPEFFTAYILVAVFAMGLEWFPAVALVDTATPFFDRLHKIALPVATLTLAVLAYVLRMTRTAIVNVLGAPFIEMAHLKGLRPSRIVLHHAMPNALGPIINVVTLNLAYLVVGVVVVEVVFAYPGMGQLLVDSVTTRDLPVVQACCLIFASVYVVLNLLADMLAMLANPRLRRRR